MPNELDLDISKFDTALADAVAESAKLGREVEKETAVLRLMERQFVKLGAASGITGKQLDAQAGVVEDLGVRLKGAQKDQAAFEKLLGVTDKTSRGFLPTLSKVRTAVGLLFSGVALGGLIRYVKSLTDYGTAVRDAALKSRVSGESFQRMTYALSQQGVGAADAASALHAVSEAMRAAQAGSVDASDKLRQLGIGFDAIRTKSPDEVFRMIADSVKGATNETDALRRMSALFGDDLATLLLRALKQGGASIKELGDKATVASDEMTEAANRGSTALERWKTSIKQWALAGVDSYRSMVEAINDAGDSQDRAADSARKLADAHARKKAREQNNGRTDLGGFSVSADAPIAFAGGLLAPNLSTGIRVTPNADDIVGKRKGVQQYDSAIGPQQPKERGPADVQSEFLANERELANRIAPEYVKQKQKLVNEETRLNGEIGFAIGLEKERLQTQLAQNKEAQRALYFASVLRDSETALNNERATKGRGYQAEQKAFANEIRDLNNQIAVAAFKHEYDRVAALKAQRHEVELSALANSEAHSDELYQLSQQTSEMQAHQKGLEGLANETAIRAKYTAEITQQLRLQNREAAALLQTQEAIELRRANAQEHDVTPEQRRQARRANRIEARKASQQEARDAELVARGERGASSDLIDAARARQSARLEQQRMIANAANSAENTQKAINAVLDIAKLMKAGG